MILRTLIVALLTIASVATAGAQCRVGASFEQALSESRDAHHQPASGHCDEGEAAKQAPRACDSMVQSWAPQGPAVAPSPSVIAVVAMVAPVLLPQSTAHVVWRADRPPDRSRRFKETYAKTGRFLV